MGLDALVALLHAIGRGHAAGELGEDLSEHALAAVAVDDALVVDEVGRSRRQRPLRYAFAHRALLEIGQKPVERGAAMTGRSARRGGGGPGCSSAGGRKAGRRRRGPWRRRALLRLLLKQLRRGGGGTQQRRRP